MLDQATVALVRDRATGLCEYFRLPQGYDLLPFQCDHIIARKHGGADDLSNLSWSCFSCNNYKGPNIAGIDPIGLQLVRLFHPRSDVWSQHFHYNGPVLLGHSEIGRTTIEVLAAR